VWCRQALLKVGRLVMVQNPIEMHYSIAVIQMHNLGQTDNHNIKDLEIWVTKPGKQ